MKITKPVKMTDKVVEKLEEAFAMDCTVEEACLNANIHKQSYYNWIGSFPEMKERFDELRHTPFLKARTTIIKNLDNPQYAFEYLKRKKKKEFGDNVDMTTGGEALQPILVKFINGNE